MEFDTIIIGSGAGGLCAAICLSKAGQKVLVLEQHDVPGGWCHSFYLKGQRFSPGVHYIGMLGPEESTYELYQGLGIANDLVFFKMNPKAYEHCWIGTERFDVPADGNEFAESLTERFPTEKKGIKKYLKLVKDVSYQLQLIPKMRGFWDHLTIPWRTRYMGKYGLFSLKRVMGWYVKDELLKKILSIQCGDHGLPPSKASFPVHCAVMDHYFTGGYYPMGGSGAIVKAMTNLIKSNGGEVRTSTKVKRILVEGDKKKKAIGVELMDGNCIYAGTIISNADPGVTYTQLVGENKLSKKLKKRLSKTKYSCTSLMLFLVVDTDVRRFGIDSGNIWFMENKDPDNLFDEMMKEDILSSELFPGLFISCTTLKDPTSFDGQHHALEVITYINYDSFSKYGEEIKERTKEYLAFKELLMEKMLSTLENVIPGIGDHIILKELGTPITNRYYINSTKGCVYGTEKTLGQVGPFSFNAKSEIEGLYHCGASILSHGVAGASYSGVQTAAKILGCRQEELIQPDPSQELQLYDAEDPSEYPAWIRKKMEVRRARLNKNK